MKKQLEYEESIIKSGTRVRESVRSLPKGHFQQIRQMFEKQTYQTKKLSTIHERSHKSLQSNILFRLPVTDDEKLKRTTTTTNIDHENPIDIHCRDYISEYQSFRFKLKNQCLEQKTLCSSNDDEQLLKQQNDLSHGNHTNQEPLSSLTSVPQQQEHNLQQTSLFKSEESPFITALMNKYRSPVMPTAISYTDSYDSLTSSSLNRTDSTRKYVSSLQNTSDTHTDPILAQPLINSNGFQDNQSTPSNDTYELLKTSGRLHSSTSLSSTGYDSNSSPSIKSKRNSIATTNSNDCIIHSTCSSSPSSSPSSSRNKQEQPQLSKPWLPYESSTINPSFLTSHYNDDVFESSNESSPMISRTEIQLSPPVRDNRPSNIIRHATVRNTNLTTSPSSATFVHEPMIATRKTNKCAYLVQTTTFSDNCEKKPDKKIRRWNNIYAERVELSTKTNYKYPLTSTTSVGFKTSNCKIEQQQQQQSDSDTCSSNFDHKVNYEQEKSSVIQVENPVLSKLPPKKPPRTFEQEEKQGSIINTKSSKLLLVSSPSNEILPITESGVRSASCIDLTTSITNASSSNNHASLKQEHNHISRRTSIQSDKASTLSNEPLKTFVAPFIANKNQETFLYNSAQSDLNTMHRINPLSNISSTKTKSNRKSTMKKGTSEPNLTKDLPNKSSFSPRALIDRFRRFLPMSLSRQTLNEKSTILNDNNLIQNDSDDSTSTSSENNDNFRTSKLDHVNRVQNFYDSLNTSNHVPSLLIDPSISFLTNEIEALYDYVVHIVPEQEVGYFSHGNGCLLSSNFNSQPCQSYISALSPIRFKYPFDAKDEATLKYFCFPDQHDSNNNPLLLMKKPTQEYFRFTLTNMHGVRQYGYCSRFFHKGTMNALCIVSPYDMIEIYEKILSTATELFLSYKDNDAKKFLEEIYHHHLPNRGDTIHIPTSTVGVYTLKCEYERRKQLIDSVALLNLSTETIIKIFSSILYEQKLIFIGNELGPLTRLINTFVCLLYPFSWPHTYVPILPALMLDIIQAPTPYIIGILRSCESYLTANDDLLSQDNSDILVIDIDHDRVRSIGDYMGNKVHHNSTENLHNYPASNLDSTHFQILPKVFKIDLKQEISLLRKTRLSLSLDECRQRLHDVFMSIFVQSCYNYQDFYNETFQREQFLQSKQHTIELFLEWFTRTQIFGLFIRQKFEYSNSNQYALTFDLACEKYIKTLPKQTSQRITAKSVKRRSATRANKQENRF